MSELGWSTERSENLHRAKEAYDSLLKQEEIFWKQKYLVKWLQEDDRNTKCFHASTIDRLKTNSILKMKREDGTIGKGRIYG